MRKAFLCLLFTIVGVYGASIFGPVSYYRTTGAPNVYDTTFAAFDTTVLCTLVVTNGDADGEGRLSAASIEFNGEEIVKERDFSESVETITRVLQLASENSLHLRLRSGPRDFLTINVHRPCDAFVDLAVDTVIDGEASFTATAGGWGDIAYSWDFDGDGEYDTTTAENTVCYTYEEADTYWASVRVEDEVGCIAEDSAEVIIELGYNYIFEIDSSYTPWSWTLPDTERHYEVTDISDNGSTVVIQTIRNLRDKYYNFYIFSGGALTAVFDSVHNVTTNHAGNKLIVAEKPITWCQDSACKISCYDANGNILWGPVLYSEKPVWSSEDIFVGFYSGVSSLNEMPAFFGDLLNRLDAIEFAGTELGSGIFTDTGLENGTNMHTAFGGIPYVHLACFRNDLGGYLSYIFRYEPGSGGLYGFENPIDDTLKMYDTRDGEFNLVNQIIPFVIPDSYNIASVTCPTINWASFDNKIYGVWGWSPDSFFQDERDFITQYVCFDSIGNLLWRQYDTTRAHAHYYSESGKYLIETKVRENGLIRLRQTETNELMFEVNYPDVGELLLADILEHPETGHVLVLAIDKQGQEEVYYQDGTISDFSLLGLSVCHNPGYAINQDGANITFYKVRW